MMTLVTVMMMGVIGAPTAAQDEGVAQAPKPAPKAPVEQGPPPRFGSAPPPPPAEEVWGNLLRAQQDYNARFGFRVDSGAHPICQWLFPRLR